MTVEELETLNLPIEANETTALYVEAAIEWINQNTTLVIDLENLEISVGELPAGAKLFLCRYYEIMTNGGTGIASESIGGMSQSFTTESKTVLLWNLARELIGSYLKGQLKSVPNTSKWR